MRATRFEGDNGVAGRHGRAGRVENHRPVDSVVRQGKAPIVAEKVSLYN